MCGRYYTEVDREEMEKIIVAVNRALSGREELNKMKTGEIFPTDIVPVYSNMVEGVSPTLMKWGFPGFVKPGSKAKPSVIINARFETIAEKPSFSKYLHQRCLVPANMYFEWAANVETADKKKPKYIFQPKDEAFSLFWMAAIYRKVADATVPVFTILTMEASASVAPIHNRMPVILGSREARHAWMKGEKDVQDLIRHAAVRDIIFSPAG